MFFGGLVENDDDLVNDIAERTTNKAIYNVPLNNKELYQDINPWILLAAIAVGLGVTALFCFI